MPEIITREVGSAGHIHLNRPKALNALTLEMVRGMAAALTQWASDDSVAAVVVTGEGERAFCAGGDVKAAWRAGKDGALGDGSLTGDFFREEYQLNYQIANYPKPYVSWLDGVTMGGGVGISILGSHRVASEHLKFAMPETAIGLFPDVGGSYFMSRMGPIGTLLALTGKPIDVASSVSLGVATHYVTREDGANLVEQIGSSGVEAVLSKIAATPPRRTETLSQLQALADRCFGSFDIEEILDSLQDQSSDSGFGELASETSQTIRKRSPTSVLVTLEQLRRGKELSLRECLIMEYRMSQACMRGHDFYEGIRAVLIDKDHAPNWNPATLEEVSDELVESHFAMLGDREPELG